MATKRSKGREGRRESVHLVLDAELARRVRAYAGYHGRTLSEVAAEGLRHVVRGFSARQEPAPAAGPRGVVSPPLGEGGEGSAGAA